jgi:DNA-binding response OmpR family regulator
MEPHSLGGIGGQVNPVASHAAALSPVPRVGLRYPSVGHVATADLAVMVPGNASVMVMVDDDEVSQEICDSLSADFHTHAAPKGVEGFVKVKEERPQLILVDADITGMSANDLIRAVREDDHVSATPIMAIAQRDDPALVSMLEYGANDFLIKPFFAEELRARARNLLRQNAAEQQLALLEIASARLQASWELHDFVVQSVYGVGMKLTSMAKNIPQEDGVRLRNVVGALQQVIEEIRTTLYELEPRVADGAIEGGVVGELGASAEG